ncbi:MAG: sugar kinase [Verrucomicrobiales bacterium]|nr:sugar kinase [Verrucomicrobiales bacterium]
MTTDNSTKGSAIGIDFGGTSVKIGSLSQLLSNNSNNVKSLKTSHFGTVDSLISAMVQVVNEYRKNEEIVTVGCGVPGLVDFDSGHIHMLTNVPGWNDIALKDIMEKELNLPVHVDNDANCMAYAEYRFGAAQGCSNVVALTLGTGIGGGLIINGKLYRGSNFAAGELGNYSIDYRGPLNAYGLKGALECYMGNKQICELAENRFQSQDLPEGGWTPEEVTNLAKGGNQIAIEIWDQIAEWLASALASTAWLLNPDAFVIGGGVAKAGRFLFDPLTEKIKNQVSDVIAKDLKILPAFFGNESGIIGSAAQALDYSAN